MKNLITIDWGTSSFRAARWECDLTLENSRVLERVTHHSGLLHLPSNSHGKKDFEARLVTLLEPWLLAATNDKPGTILMSGMVGSKSGWQEAPYCATPANIQTIARACIGVQTTHATLVNWQCLIAPGVSQTDPADVMRGEETQLLGCQPDLMRNEPQVFVMPGTHSKHVWMHGQVITKFATIMTGELFALISQQSILKPVIEAQEKLQELHTAESSRLSFLNGLRLSLNSTEPLLQRIFSLRAQALLNQNTGFNTLDQLSGVLIGDELKTLGGQVSQVTLVGQESLCQRYQLALSELGIETKLQETKQQETTLHVTQAAEQGALKIFLALQAN